MSGWDSRQNEEEEGGRRVEHNVERLITGCTPQRACRSRHIVEIHEIAVKLSSGLRPI